MRRNRNNRILFSAALLLAILLTSLFERAWITEAAAKPRFHVGQVVAVTTGNTDPPQYFRIGFIARRVDPQGKVFFEYTENERDFPVLWSEDAIRELTRQECRR